MKPNVTLWLANKSFFLSLLALLSPRNPHLSFQSPSKIRPIEFGRKTVFATANPRENSSILAARACTLCDSLSPSSYVVNAKAIIHRNQVSFNSNRVLFVPAIARQIRARFLHIREVNSRFKRLSDHWNALHRIDEDSSAGNRGWKDDLENKRDKRLQRADLRCVFKHSAAINTPRDAQPDVDYGGGGICDATRRIEGKR